MSFNIDSVTQALQNTRVSPSGVTFAGRSLKLDTEEDAKEVIEQIEKCTELQYLNLEGNTLGVEASKAIAKALEKHPEFKRALWKDMFTGRMKTEIPKALQYLGNGLVTAGTRLTELDLSDNAFGPIGVEGLASLLRSPTCYALEELRLNNNGLGITGGKLLASALTDCYNSSKNEGKPLALKVFIAGRNRLENEGAKALASVFKMIGTLEEIAMPQNGIYHVGISALSEAFTHNSNLQILNLNDNTIGKKGAEAISKALPNLQNLKEINFGDCLLKTQGAILLAHGLKGGHEHLEELILGFNEIKIQGGTEILDALSNKSKLKNLMLDGNQFGGTGRDILRDKLQKMGKVHVLGSVDEDESEDGSSEEETSDHCDSESSNSDDEGVKITEIVEEPEIGNIITFSEFISSPSAQNFIALGDHREETILKEAKKNGQIEIESFIPVLMKVSALSNNSKTEVANGAQKCAEKMYKELFTWAEKEDELPSVNNSILVSLELIKSEDKKKPKPTWNIDGCLNALKNIVKLNFVPESTKNTLQVFMQRQINVDEQKSIS